MKKNKLESRTGYRASLIIMKTVKVKTSVTFSFATLCFLSCCALKELSQEKEETLSNFSGSQRLRFKSDASGTDCFWQNMLASSKVSIYYRVIKGGDVKINARVLSSKNLLLRKFGPLSTNQQTIDVKESGVHGLCFDNMNRFNAKIVEFYISLIDSDSNDEYLPRRNEEDKSDAFDVVFRSALLLTMKLSRNIESMRMFAYASYGRLAADTSQANVNENFVFFWSLGQCCLIVLVAIAQVYTLRCMFREKSPVTGFKSKV